MTYAKIYYSAEKHKEKYLITYEYDDEGYINQIVIQDYTNSNKENNDFQERLNNFDNNYN